MSLVDQYHDRYFDKNTGQVVGVRYDGPVGNQTMNKYNLGLDVITPPGSTEEGKLDILTPPGSTAHGGLEPITPPSKDSGTGIEDLFLKMFMQKEFGL